MRGHICVRERQKDGETHEDLKKKRPIQNVSSKASYNFYGKKNVYITIKTNLKEETKLKKVQKHGLKWRYL